MRDICERQSARQAQERSSFDAAIAELERGDLRRKHGPIELRVSPAKIRAELHRAVECYFENKAAWLTPPTKVKAKYDLLLRDLDRTRAHLVEIFQNSALLRPLIASDKPGAVNSSSR